ncbi:hypothetical protein [uncultured Kordia sp.]|uniref:hypothetical protein n=1 Tax=uncultured Kordia sp. TaxID=507699 RepID=UPI002622BAA9|nr:hypothetical protein [uncultured Kordia sp.]
MKKKQLQSLALNKKVVSSLNAQKTNGGFVRISPQGTGPGSVPNPCESIQLPCSHQDTCDNCQTNTDER